MVDALFLLKDYCMHVDTSVEISAMLSNCIFRIVRTLCNLLTMMYDLRESRQNLFPIIHLLLNCLIHPGYSKCVRFKMDVYGSILTIFDTLNTAVANEKVKETTSEDETNGSFSSYSKINKSQSLTSLMGEEKEKVETWSKIFESITSEIVATISSDITFAPLSLKIVATSCLSDIIREDIINSQSVAPHFIRSGAMRCVLDTLSKVVTEFKRNSKSNTQKAEKQALLLKALFVG